MTGPLATFDTDVTELEPDESRTPPQIWPSATNKQANSHDTRETWRENPRNLMRAKFIPSRDADSERPR